MPFLEHFRLFQEGTQSWGAQSSPSTFLSFFRWFRLEVDPRSRGRYWPLLVPEPHAQDRLLPTVLCLLFLHSIPHLSGEGC